MLSPAGLVGFSAGRRLQKLNSAPRALARLQLYVHVHYVHIHMYTIWHTGPWTLDTYTDPYPVPPETTNTVYH